VEAPRFLNKGLQVVACDLTKDAIDANPGKTLNSSLGIFRSIYNKWGWKMITSS